MNVFGLWIQFKPYFNLLKGYIRLPKVVFTIQLATRYGQSKLNIHPLSIFFQKYGLILFAINTGSIEKGGGE